MGSNMQYTCHRQEGTEREKRKRERGSGGQKEKGGYWKWEEWAICKRGTKIWDRAGLREGKKDAQESKSWKALEKNPKGQKAMESSRKHKGSDLAIDGR